MLSKFTPAIIIRQAFRPGGFLASLIILFSLSSYAQTAPKENDMPLDENGKYIYYEVVTGIQEPADSLHSRAITFLKSKKLSALSGAKDHISASGKFLISKTALVLTRPSGEVHYKFAFEIKADKYRLWLTDFVFIPYKRDRYANFVPSTDKGTPLETEPAKLNAGEWASYLTAASKSASNFAADFKTFLATARNQAVKPQPKKTVSTKSW